MLRNMEIRVKVEQAYPLDTDRAFLASQEDGVFIRVVWNEWFARGTFDREGTRIEVSLTRIFDFHDGTKYMLSVPNLQYAHEFSAREIGNIAYKMREKTIWSQVDCESVQMACYKLKQLMDSYQEELDTDVRQNLVKAIQSLDTAKELIEVGNDEKSTDPELSDVFGGVVNRVEAINQIINKK